MSTSPFDAIAEGIGRLRVLAAGVAGRMDAKDVWEEGYRAGLRGDNQTKYNDSDKAREYHAGWLAAQADKKSGRADASRSVDERLRVAKEMFDSKMRHASGPAERAEAKEDYDALVKALNAEKGRGDSNREYKFQLLINGSDAGGGGGYFKTIGEAKAAIPALKRRLTKEENKGDVSIWDLENNRRADSPGQLPVGMNLIGPNHQAVLDSMAEQIGSLGKTAKGVLERMDAEYTTWEVIVENKKTNKKTGFNLDARTEAEAKRKGIEWAVMEAKDTIPNDWKIVSATKKPLAWR